ncbi:hypothetical protein GL325_02710 [Aeromicrobium sp. 636]|uniref:Uncharacterized protein n=1 Tax=Aeromicrobium senzhongii TaxID=2663859 RepID=A0A8I0EU93_9ACTN|nr:MULTISPECIES: hypothetical protein [Aeromicrobium]MBC9225227.1 hypothetical protein [Aeromicrobium senzhongii]MCQ3997337.1 hypothetical protein [Aeromicrobium sp. 636]MTB87274.1 hypothetical protein [Aeromicrobium senzhongii]QNL95659.1 hypothetical protein H9L21_07070 [Aeromicrobium senzhongii]
MTEREPVFSDLRAMYEAIDPPPAHLADAMIAVIAAEDLDNEYELLSLVNRSTALVGTRGSGPLTIEFAYDDVTVLVRVTEGPTSDTRRIDGWVTPAHDGGARLQRGDDALTADLVAGRFEFDEVPAGLVRIWFEVADRDNLATPTFEI